MNTIPEFDPVDLKRRNDEREATEAATKIRESFEYHMLRTGSFGLAIRDTRLMARDSLGFKSEVGPRACTFFKQGSFYRIVMTQGEHECFEFATEQVGGFRPS